MSEAPPDRGALLTRVLGDGRVIDLWQQIFNWKVTISQDLEVGWSLDEW